MSPKKTRNSNKCDQRQLKEACKEGKLVGAIQGEEAKLVICTQRRFEVLTLAEEIQRRNGYSEGEGQAMQSGSNKMALR